jgi:hypothetical protein
MDEPIEIAYTSMALHDCSGDGEGKILRNGLLMLHDAKHSVFIPYHNDSWKLQAPKISPKIKRWSPGCEF